MEEGQRPLGRASPSKRARFHLAFTWEKPALLSRVTWVNYIYFSLHETRNPIFAYKSSFYNLHINKQNLYNEKLSKKKNAGQDKLCRVYGALTCQAS